MSKRCKRLCLAPRADSGIVRTDLAAFPGRMSYKATKPGSVCPVS